MARFNHGWEFPIAVSESTRLLLNKALEWCEENEFLWQVNEVDYEVWNDFRVSFKLKEGFNGDEEFEGTIYLKKVEYIKA
jgi:hypothetical protein